MILASLPERHRSEEAASRLEHLDLYLEGWAADENPQTYDDAHHPALSSVNKKCIKSTEVARCAVVDLDSLTSGDSMYKPEVATQGIFKPSLELHMCCGASLPMDPDLAVLKAMELTGCPAPSLWPKTWLALPLQPYTPPPPTHTHFPPFCCPSLGHRSLPSNLSQLYQLGHAAGPAPMSGRASSLVSSQGALRSDSQGSGAGAGEGRPRHHRLNQLMEQLAELVPGAPGQEQGAKPGDSCVRKRPRHVLLADTIQLLQRLGCSAHGAPGAQLPGAMPPPLDISPATTGVTVVPGKRRCEPWTMRIACCDRPDLLADVSAALRGLPLSIASASVTTTPVGKAHQVYRLIVQDTQLTPDEVRCAVNAALYAHLLDAAVAAATASGASLPTTLPALRPGADQRVAATAPSHPGHGPLPHWEPLLQPAEPCKRMRGKRQPRH